MKDGFVLWNALMVCLLFTCINNLNGTQRALVTGGAGFLGSHMCEKLLQEEYEVICLDNLYSGDKQNIAHLLQNPHFQFVQHDIEKYYDPGVILDEIYNFACPASPIFYQLDPLKTMRTNVFGAINLLDLAKSHNTIIFQASTSEIYGDPLVHPQTESYWGNVNPIGIRSCYDEGKRSAETLFFDYHRKYSVRIKVARIFNTYGPRMRLDDGRVVSNFLVQALKNEPITIYGNGMQTRSFCYVSDLIDGIYALMHTPDSVTGPVNLGNPGEFTMIDLANKIIQFTNSSSMLIYKALPSDDPKRRQPDISLTTRLISWSPKVHLDDGLKMTCPYFIHHLESKNS